MAALISVAIVGSGSALLFAVLGISLLGIAERCGWASFQTAERWLPALLWFWTTASLAVAVVLLALGWLGPC